MVKATMSESESSTRITYAEVRDLLASEHLWSGEGELIWYEWGWSVLEKHGLTKCSNSYETAIVFVRAYALIFIYAELCELLADLTFEYEVYPDEESLSPVALGYILAKSMCAGEDDYDTQEMDEKEALFLCVESQRSIVAEALRDFANNQSALVVFMKATFPPDELISEDELYDNLSYDAEMALDWLRMGTHHLKDGPYV